MPGTDRLQEVRTALSVASARTERLVVSLADTSAPIPGCAWTVREAAVHLAMVGFRYVGMVHGEPSQFPSLDPEACARLNDQLNADIPESHPVALAALLHEATARLLAASAACDDGHGVLFHGGTVLTVPRLLGAALAEHLLHGSDIASAFGRSWPADPHHAALAVAASGAGFGLGCPSASQSRERNLT